MKIMQWFDNHVHMEEARHHDGLTIIPLIANVIAGPDYCSLKKGLESGLRITEIGKEGTVPTLKAFNETDSNVLILDGEELAGSKQNRVLNTTVLIPAGAVLELPVSCTEQGRWHWSSPKFMDSNVVMSPGMRGRKNENVYYNLKLRGRYESNQSEIWRDIHELSRAYGIASETLAMKDTFEAKRDVMKSFWEAVPCLPNQCGMLAVIYGNVVSLEVISRPSVYADLHQKLLGSLVMDISLWEPASDPESMDGIPVFLKHAMHTLQECYPSIGMGRDVRLRGHHLIGSALQVESDYVHITLFHQSRNYRAHRSNQIHPTRRL